MSGVWQLFVSDLRRATSNVMALIVLCGLIVIPAAFTWFNVIGSWQPFANTDHLKVAVASEDKGYTSPLMPLHVNIGSMVESELRANDQLDWIITSKDDAISGTESGEYYAAIVLPEDFSERMLTFYTAGSQRTSVDYYTNDKSNPLAPLITAEGADELSAKINAEFTRELTDIALSLVSSLATSVGGAEADVALSRIEAHLGDVAVQLRAASGTAAMFSSVLEASAPLVAGASGLLANVESGFSAEAGRVREGLDAAIRAESAIDAAAQALTAAFSASREQLDAFASEVDTVFTGIDADVDASIAAIDQMADDIADLISAHEAFRTSLVDDVLPNLPEEDRPAFEMLLEGLDDAIAQERAVHDGLRDASAAIATGRTDIQQFRTRIEDRIAAALSAFSDAGAVYANDLQPVLRQLAEGLGAAGAALNAITGDLANLSATADGVGSLLEGATRDSRALTESLSSAADEVAGMQQALSAAIDSGDFSRISQIIGANPSVLATAIAQPIGIERIAVYPVVSFGAGMAPLYTVLSLWVGALLLAVTLRVEAPLRATDGGPLLTLNQQFFGRYAIFAVMGLAQSTLVFLGDILLVGLDPVHPLLLLLTGWVSSLVFTFIIYTLIVSFSDAGKALAVFLLVIQVAGAGGAYPLVLLPEWFQSISPFLPATHAIDAFRAALAGIYHADYWISLGLLLAFIVPMLLLGTVLRRPLVGINQKMEQTLESTKLM